jgi:hypothetical protein
MQFECLGCGQPIQVPTEYATVRELACPECADEHWPDYDALWVDLGGEGG